MPKVKTHSGTKKRFKLTASGKVKHRKANRSHLMRKRLKKVKRQARTHTVLQNKGDEKRIKKLLNIL